MRPHQVPDELRGGPFLRRTAIEAGVTCDALRGPAYRRLLHTVHVAADVPDSLELRCDAVVLVAPPGAALSHGTAAQLYGAPVPEDMDVHLTVPAGVTVPDRRAWLHPHEGLDPVHLCIWQGRPVTSPELTFLQLAPTTRLDELVCVGDHLVRHACATRDSLARAVDAASRRRGVVRAREAVALVRAGVDSAPETRTRLLLVRAGLPEPVVGLDARDRWGGWIARPDLSYPEYRIAIEYEGEHHREERQWLRDVERDAIYAEHGWLLVKVTKRTLEHPYRLVQRVSEALRRRGYPGPLPC